ncbi:hypothetical protein SFC65_19875 [Priestia filamentosa]|uniref:hypothetical protein n=1 Tax=Priestia filamentosa TaxID=1402861 RepID=UPI00398286E9
MKEECVVKKTEERVIPIKRILNYLVGYILFVGGVIPLWIVYAHEQSVIYLGFFTAHIATLYLMISVKEFWLKGRWRHLKANAKAIWWIGFLLNLGFALKYLIQWICIF